MASRRFTNITFNGHKHQFELGTKEDRLYTVYVEWCRRIGISPADPQAWQHTVKTISNYRYAD